MCEVDLGQDARRWPTIDAPAVGPTLGIEELAADKTLALFGRAAPRDSVDTHALANLLGEDRLCELAADKDPGFRRTYLADALVKIYRLDRDQFGATTETLSELR